MLTLEMARGLAACAVVLFHANAAARYFSGPSIPFLSIFEHGVDFFFVLSGFLIYQVHRGEIGRPDAARAYILKRLIRLLPLLWLVVIGYALFRSAVSGEAIDGARLLNSLLLYPSLDTALPQVVWTLRHEMLFYTVFLVLILNRRLGLSLFALWSVAALVQLALSIAGQPIGGIWSFFMSPLQLDFLFGALVAQMHRSGRFRMSWLPLLGAVAALVAAMIIEESFAIRRTHVADYVSLAATLWTVILGVIFAAVLHGLLVVERHVRVPRFLLLLGGASYAIYLVHTPVNSIAQRVAAHFPEPALAIGLGHIFVAAAGITAGIFLHLVYEKPVTALLRQRLLGKRPPSSPDSRAATAPL